MSGQVNKNATEWEVKGNIVDETVSNPDTVDVFTANSCTLTLEDAVVVDGNSIKMIKAVPNF